MKPDALTGPIPAGMRVWTEGGKPLTGDPYRTGEPEPGRLIIVHQWRDTQGMTAQVVGCAFLWIIVALFAGAVIGPELGLLPLWIWLFAMAVGMSWIVVSSIWNTTRITVEPSRLVVRHGPIAIVPGRELACRDLDELYCKQIELAGNQGPPQNYEGGTNRTGSLLLRQSRADRELILRHRSRPHFCSTSRRRAPN